MGLSVPTLLCPASLMQTMYRTSIQLLDVPMAALTDEAFLVLLFRLQTALSEDNRAEVRLRACACVMHQRVVRWPRVNSGSCATVGVQVVLSERNLQKVWCVQRFVWG